MKDKVCSYLDQVGVWLESPDLVENAYNPVNVFTRTFMAIDSVGFAAAVLEGIDAGKALKAVIDARRRRNCWNLCAPNPFPCLSVSAQMIIAPNRRASSCILWMSRRLRRNWRLPENKKTAVD